MFSFSNADAPHAPYQWSKFAQTVTLRQARCWDLYLAPLCDKKLAKGQVFALLSSFVWAHHSRSCLKIWRSWRLQWFLSTLWAAFPESPSDTESSAKEMMSSPRGEPDRGNLSSGLSWAKCFLGKTLGKPLNLGSDFPREGDSAISRRDQFAAMFHSPRSLHCSFL